MIVWTVALIAGFSGVRLLIEEWDLPGRVSLPRREAAGLQGVSALLTEIQETLEAGLVPEPERWRSLRELPAPWGELSFQSLQALRDQGGAVLPTLRRLRVLAENHLGALQEARAKSAQALGQALVCSFLVPVFGSALYHLLPGVNARSVSWLLACALAILVSGAGALWLLSLAEDARWGGLRREERVWVLAAQCAGERFLASVRCGLPADLAWVKCCELLATEAPALAAAWGYSLWVPSQPEATGPRRVLVEAGFAIRKAIHVSLMEGLPCTERVETALHGLRQDLRAQAERELGLLATRALKPLFLCVAPALLALLFFGLYLGWVQASGEGAWFS